MSTQNERSVKAQIIWNSTNSNSVTPTMVGSLFYDINAEKLERDNSNAVYQTYDASYTKVAAINPTTKKMTLIDIPSVDLSNYYKKTETFSQTDITDFLNNKQNNLGYTPENVANKSDSYTSSSSTNYASTKALVDGLATKQKKLSSFNESILIETDGNIEGNVSLFEEYFEQQECELNFTPIQIIGVYLNGIKQKPSLYTIIPPKTISVTNFVTNDYIEIQYTHLK